MHGVPASPQAGRFIGRLSRRRLLTRSAESVAATLAILGVAPSLQRALAQTPSPRASLDDVRHVVILMLENRSFDHYFSTLAGVRGFGDANALTLSNGQSVFYQPDPQNPDGYMLPFHLDTSTTAAQKIPSTSHEWSVQHAAWNQGGMDHWLPAHRSADGGNGPFTMGYYTRADLPFHYALADAFTICDNYFCSVLGPTHPNRLYLMTGSIDASGSGGGPITSNTHPQPLRWTTYAERLQAAGVSWRVYQEHDNYDCNALAWFQSFQDAPQSSPLWINGMQRLSAGQFEWDARNDQLPQVSWIVMPSTQSEHPDYWPAAGAAYVASKLDAIAANPDVWNTTVFILDYDENDGLFDHVPPPVAPAETPDEIVDGAPIGPGFRVPALLISPYTQGGWVCSDPFDHTSVIRFLTSRFGVAEPNISAYRSSVLGDLTTAFRQIDTPVAAFPSLPDAEAALSAARSQVQTLPRPTASVTPQVMPQQASTRPGDGTPATAGA
jgi:phospholipase C